MNGRIDWAELFLSATGRLARTPFVIAAVAILVLIALYEAVVHTTLHWLTGWFVYPAVINAGPGLLTINDLVPVSFKSGNMAGFVCQAG